MLDLQAARPPQELVERYRAAGFWRTDTVLDDVARWAGRIPDRPALIGVRADGAENVLTWSGLDATVGRYAAGLHDLGIGPGDVVSTWLPSRVELAAVLLACWRLGAIASPMMPTFGPRDVEAMAAHVGSSVFVTVDGADGVEHAAALAAMAPRLPALRHQVVLGTPGEGQFAFDACVPADDPVPPNVADPDAPALVLYTSGTTGEPKAVVSSLNTRSGVLPAENPGGDSGVDSVSDDVAYNPHTLSHAGGLTRLLSSLTRGGTVVITERWDPDLAAGLFDRWHITNYAAAPTFTEQLLSRLGPGGAPPPQVAATIGTAPSRALSDAVLRRWGIPLHAGWGMTEVSPPISTLGGAPPRSPADIGRPAPGLEVRLRPVDGRPVDREHPGALHVRGPGVCLAVARRGDPTPVRLSDHDDGWFNTGDLAAPDGEGGYLLLGRAADRVGGSFMIPTGEVEDALRDHPSIADVALIETDRDGEPVACAVVVPSGGARPRLDDLRAFLLGTGMTPWFVPERLEILDALPRNASGKVLKAALRSRYAG